MIVSPERGEVDALPSTSCLWHYAEGDRKLVDNLCTSKSRGGAYELRMSVTTSPQPVENIEGYARDASQRQRRADTIDL